MPKEFVYEILEDYGIVDEKGNQGIFLRRVSMMGKEGLIDVRKWNCESGQMLKGVTFFTDEGFNNLLYKAIECGFGDEKKILDALEKRKENGATQPEKGTKKPSKKDEDEEDIDLDAIEKDLFNYK